MSITNGPDLINGTSAANTIDGLGGDDIIFARGGDDVVEGGGDDDLIFGQAGADSLSGGDGEDRILGGRGADTINGGAGDDTVAYEEALFTEEGSITVELNGGGDGWVVRTFTIEEADIVSEGVDRLADVEVIEDADGARVLLVGAGGFATLQEAVDEAESGDTILIATGTYAGATITGKALTIRGQGAGSTTIDGQITIDGTVTGDTAIEDLAIDAAGQQYGVLYNAIAGQADMGLTLDGVAVSGAIENGLLYVRPGNSANPTITSELLSDITIRDSVFTDNGTGAGSNARAHVNLFGFNGDLTVVGNDFVVTSDVPAGAARKGFSWTGAPRTGTLSPAGEVVFTDNDFSGYYLTDVIAFYYFASFASFTAGGNTADVSAPWGVLNADVAPAVLDVSGFFAGTPQNAIGPIAVLQGAEGSGDTLTGTDQADVLFGRGGLDDLEGGAGNDAFTIVLSSEHGAGETIDGGAGTDTIRFFGVVPGDTLVLTAGVTGVEEARIVSAGASPGAGLPTPILTTGTTVLGIDASAVTGMTTLAGNDGANALTGGAGAQTITGNGGNDTLAGGEGDDSLDGGSGGDVAAYDAALVADDIDLVGGQWVVSAGVAEGTDALAGISEVLAGGARFLLVGAGGYATIQDAVDAAESGDTILVADGRYDGAVTIDKGVTLLGANRGVAGTGSRGPESVVAGPVTISTTERVVVDGFEFLDDRAYTLSASDAYTALSVLQHATAMSGGHLVANSVFLRDPASDPAGFNPVLFASSGAQPTHRGIDVAAVGAGAAFTVSGNLFAGTNDYFYAGDSWRSAIYSNGGAGATAITDNAFSNVRTALNLDDYTSAVAVTGNDFISAGSAISIGGAATVPGDLGSISGNSFGRVDTDINAQNLSAGQPVTIDVEALGGPPTSAAEPFTALGGAAADLLTGSSGLDALTGNGGADTLTGDDLADTLLGGIGADSLDGGEGADSIDGGADGDVVAAGGGADTVAGAGGTDSIAGGEGADSLDGGSENDTIAGGAGADVLKGGAGIDTATYGVALSVAAFSVVGGAWQVDAGAEGIDSLDGVEVVTAGGVTYRLVGAGGYTSIQAAVNAAGEDDVILIAPGTYTETSAGVGGGQPQGLYIDTAGLTLVGFSSATGLAIASAQEAKEFGPVVVSGAQNQFGANHWIDTGGTGGTIQGLHLKAGLATDNKLLEIWADGTVVEDSFLNVFATDGTDEVYTFAVAIYVNDTSLVTDVVASYDIRDNILNEGIVVASGVGDPNVAPTAASDERITGNLFEGTFDTVTGEGRYDTIVINGEVNGIGWLIEPTGTPWIAGNTFANNTVPFLLRGSDNSAGNLPDAATVAAFLANNGDAATTYAYVVDVNGDIVTATRDVGGGPFQSLFVVNGIETVNLGLDATPDAVFGGQRVFLNPTDTLVVQSGAGTTNSAILVDDVTVQATANSADLNLTLGTELVDGTPIAGGGVVTLTLGDHGLGLGADVDVTGNALGNAITGNSGDNRIDGNAGNDTLTGGAGLDTLLGGTDDDVIETDGGDSIDGGDGTDEVRSAVTFSLATDATAVEDLTLTGGDDIDGTGNAASNVITGNAGANLIDGGAGADTMAGGAGDDTYVVDDAGDVVTENAAEGTDLVLSSVSYTLGTEVEDLSLTGTDDIDGTGNGLDNVIAGNAGANILDGAAGADTMTGGAGDDTYVVEDVADTVVEGAAEGADLVLATVSVVLSDNVENLTLVDPATDFEDFEAFDLGPIANGENGWRYVGGAKDQAVVDLAGDQAFRMSSDPSVGDFSGPYSPGLPATAGEPGTTADFDSMQITFDFQAVVPGGDQSRLEVDFGIEAGTDRNNFMVIESTAAGIRIAVADPTLPDGDFDTGNGTINNFAAFTGNRTLVEGVDSSVEHTLTMVVRFFDGPDNDVIDFYLDEAYIGSSTSFENYRIGIGQDHATAAEANQVNRLFFRGSAGPAPGNAPQDGAGIGLNQGFYFDDISSSVFDAEGPDGTGNALANAITGNSGGNALSGEGGADTLAGGLGADALTGGEGGDSLEGGLGIDVATYAATLTASDIQALPGAFTVAAGVPEGTDTIAGVEIVAHGGAGRFLLVGNGGFGTLAAALAVAAAGDTIILQGGTHEGGFAVGFDLTILGRDGATIEGGIVLQAGDLAIEGVAIEQAAATGVGIQVLAAAGTGSLTLTDVTLTGPGTAEGSRGVEVVANGSAVTVSGGSIGDFTSGIYLNPGSSLTVTGTAFTGNVAAIGTDAPALLDVQGATFDGNGEAVGFTGGTLNPDVTLSGNTYVGATDEVKLFGTPTETLPGTFDGVVVSAPASLQDALDAADAGETVYVGAGDYGAGPFTVPAAVAAVQGGAAVVAGTLQLAAAGSLTLLGTAAFAVLGTAGADTILGNDGANTLDGSGAGDSLAGGEGSDSIDGGAGADTMAGGAGDDVYVVGQAGEVVSEAVGAGTDEVRSSITLTLVAQVENLTLIGAGSLNGTGNGLANVIAGGEGNNSLNGAGGNDTLLGGGGADTLFGGQGADSMVGGSDLDAVEFFGAASGVSVDLGTGLATGFGADTLSGIETVLGTALNDTVLGDAEANRLVGRAGDDELTGGQGDDTLEGGAGGDVLFGSAGIDLATYATSTGAVAVTLATGAGTAGDADGDLLGGIENLTGGSGSDTLEGNADDNRLEGGEGDDVLAGLAGNDTLVGGGGTDTASYEASTAAVNVQLGTGTATDGFGGTDQLVNIENAIGGSVGDSLQGSAVANLLDGRNGDDQLNGGSGNDTLQGGAGVDSLSGGAEDDVLVGGAGFDILNGQGGNDTFAFLSDGDLGTTRSATDRISAFDGAGVAVGDLIDLSALDANLATPGDDAFTFLGIGNIAFGGPGQIRAVTVSNITYLEINNDADAAVDLVLRVNGTVAFTGDDFIL